MKTLQKEEKTPHILLCLTICYILIPLHHIIVKTECAYAVNHILPKSCREMLIGCAQAMIKQLTPVADNSYRWRGEDEYALPKQRELPQHHYLLPEKLDELGHAASRVGDLQGASSGKCGHFGGLRSMFQSIQDKGASVTQVCAFRPSFQGACSDLYW